MNLHIYYETATPYPLQRIDVVIEVKTELNLDSLFKVQPEAFKGAGEMEIDAPPILFNIPQTA